MMRKRGWREYLLAISVIPLHVTSIPMTYRSGNTRLAIQQILCICWSLGLRGAMRRIQQWDAGHVPLAAAANRGDVATVESLLADGAAIDDVTPRGLGALAVAIEAEHFDLAYLLLERGAPVCNWSVARALETDRDDLTSALLAVHRRQESGPLLGEVLGLAVSMNHVDAAAKMLASGSGPVTPWMLTHAAGQGSLPLVRLLLDHGADPNAAFCGSTALGSAAACGHTEVVSELVARGADPVASGAP